LTPVATVVTSSVRRSAFRIARASVSVMKSIEPLPAIMSSRGSAYVAEDKLPSWKASSAVSSEGWPVSVTDSYPTNDSVTTSWLHDAERREASRMAGLILGSPLCGARW